MVRKLVLSVGLLFALTISGALIAGLVWPRISDVKTGETPAYPDLQPQQFTVATYRVFDAAIASARELGWHIVREDRVEGEIDALDAGLFGGTEDITITIKSGRSDNCTVYVHSRSRLGKSDFGSNARRIRRFQKELGSRL